MLTCIVQRWKWAIVGRREWDPIIGVVGPDSEELLDSLCVPFSQDGTYTNLHHSVTKVPGP